MIAILDFGSQYTQLIARRIREAHVYCEVLPYWTKPEELKSYKGIVLSGSPKSTSSDDSPTVDPGIYNLGVPLLGLCYGLQMTAKHFGGQVKRVVGEYGRTETTIKSGNELLKGLPQKMITWMSHGDSVTALPEGFEIIASSESCPIAAVQYISKGIYGLQFHPEVSHTQNGSEIIENFVLGICKEEPSWKMSSFAASQAEWIKKTVGTDHVIAAVSGGVDSVVTAVLMHRAIGDQLHVFFVDHGFLRMGERDEVVATLSNLGLKPTLIDASQKFISSLKGVTDPETKRKTIGKLFIEEFEKALLLFKNAKWLAQGTLYPDIIESSGGVSGLTDKIKSHHNVGGLPDEMKLELIEPVKSLFKDEVRELGSELGIPKHLTGRQPFPGPGLAIRIIGEVTPEKLEVLGRADKIVREELDGTGFSDQYFAVLLPIQTVGVKGDERSYQSVCAVRAVSTHDYMTAEWTKVPYEILDRIATRLTGEIREVGRVVYDITNKPPGTIEWE
jgi:GMP synthase (glutamine-hydrolysing)